LKELAQVLPAKSKRQIQGLLKELQRQGRVYVKGKTNAGRWFPAPVADN
jgi:hypothetical protein